MIMGMGSGNHSQTLNVVPAVLAFVWLSLLAVVEFCQCCRNSVVSRWSCLCIERARIAAKPKRTHKNATREMMGQCNMDAKTLV